MGSAGSQGAEGPGGKNYIETVWGLGCLLREPSEDDAGIPSLPARKVLLSHLRPGQVGCPSVDSVLRTKGQDTQTLSIGPVRPDCPRADKMMQPGYAC